MVLKHEANDEYKKLPPNEKYDDHVGGMGDAATHLPKSHPATVGPVKGKSTVIVAERVVVRTILELCGAGLIDLDSDWGSVIRLVSTVSLFASSFFVSVLPITPGLMQSAAYLQRVSTQP